MKAPQKTPSAIAFGSASGRTMPASLPPSSRVSRFTVSAEERMIALPASVEPVNMTLPTAGCSARRAPIVRSPDTARSTPSGRAELMTSMRARTESGVILLGLTTAVLPMRRAGAICQTVIIMGQFQGPIAPTTPIGR